VRFPQLNDKLNNTPQCRHDTAPSVTSVNVIVRVIASVSGGRAVTVQPLLHIGRSKITTPP
jgi:hypothetical protein